MFKKTWIDDVIGALMIAFGIMNLDYAQWAYWETLNAVPLNPLKGWFIDYGYWINLQYLTIVLGFLITYGEQWFKLFVWILEKWIDLIDYAVHRWGRYL